MRETTLFMPKTAVSMLSAVDFNCGTYVGGAKHMLRSDTYLKIITREGRLRVGVLR